MPGITPLSPGDPASIGGYRLLGRLGSGGQGIVYQGHSAERGLVAIKVLHTDWLAEPGAHSRLVKEVTAARRVAPFCTAPVLEASLDDNPPYVVSEFIPGLSLNEHVRQEGPLTGTALERLAVGTMTALVAIHEANLVHRDVKPSNVVLGPDGPRVVDFGIARDLTGHGTRTDALLGTPAFMAPEQVAGAGAGPAADLFSWAITILFAATGRSPFDGGHIAAVLYRVATEEVDLSAVPPGLGQVLSVCLAKDPAARPSSRQALMVLLGQPTPTGAAGDGQALLARAATLVAEPDTTALAGPRPGSGAAAATVPGFTPAAAPQTWSGPRSEPVGDLAPSGSAVLAPSGAGPSRQGPRRVSWWSLLLAGVGVIGVAAGGTLAVLASRDPGPAPIVVGDGPLVPASFAGTWTGSVTENSSHYAVSVELRAGSTVGRLRYPISDCQAVLVLTEVSTDGRSLTLSASTTHDPKDICGEHAEIVLAQVTPATDGASQSGGAPSLLMSSCDLDYPTQDDAEGTVTRTG